MAESVDVHDDDELTEYGADGRETSGVFVEKLEPVETGLKEEMVL